MSSSKIAKDTIFNILVHILPLIFGLISIPLLMKNIGFERFGLVSLAWSLIGYFGFFDLGLGKSLTKFVADHGREKDHPLQFVEIRKTIFVAFCFSIFIALAFAFFADPFVNKILKINSALKSEFISGLELLAVCIPFTVLASCLRGVFEGSNNFKRSNWSILLTGIGIYILPAFISSWQPTLPFIFKGILAARIIGVLVLLDRSLFIDSSQRSAGIRGIFGYGGWVAALNLIGPFLTYLDRWMIGALISSTIMAYYLTP